MGFEIASISKLEPSSHQNCSHFWQTEALIFVTSDHICHKICNCSQLSFVTIGQNIQNWSKLSLLITIFTIIKSHLSLVIIGKNCHKWSKLSQMFRTFTIVQNSDNEKNCQIIQNCHNWSHLSKTNWSGLIFSSLKKFGQV